MNRKHNCIDPMNCKKCEDRAEQLRHDAEVRKAALLEAVEWFKPKHTYEEMNVGLVQEKLRRMAEGEQK